MPIVTLTTDLGKDTHRLAKVKMQLLAVPQVHVIDISHHVLPHAVDEAYYLLSSCVDDFVSGTVHIVGVDADLYKYKRLLAIEHKGQVFVTADNGFAGMLGTPAEIRVYELPVTEPDILSPFPLKTVLVPAVLKILADGLEAAARPVETWLEKTLEQPFAEANSLRGKVVYVNSLYNAVTNITRSVFDNERMGRYFEIAINRFDRITEISYTYSQVPEGEGLCFFNENGLLEVAVNRGKAAQLLGLERGKMISIDFSAEPPRSKTRPGGLL